MKLYAYNNASASAKALAGALGIKMLKHEGSRYKSKRGDIVINWGASDCPFKSVGYDNFRVLNFRDAVGRAVNKLSCFLHLQRAQVSIPDFCVDKDYARALIQEGAVVCRTKLTGHSGEGIVIANTEDELVDAPLYTQYIKKKEEYRLHVMHNEVFFVQRKARKLEIPNEEVNWQVRNLAGGFIYANQDVEIAEEAKEQAVKAIIALGLDFGAVDVILGTDKQFYVLEVNTACGLAGTTLDKYVEQFKRYEL